MGTSLVFMFSVFVAGILSFFSPCIFPLLPVYLGILLDESKERTVSFFGFSINWYSLLKTLAFMAGLSSVFLLLGFGAASLGSLFNSPNFRVVMGLIIIVLGLHQMEWINIASLQKQKQLRFNFQTKNGFLSAFFLGLTFSFGWTPCVGPVLGSVLGLAASGGGSSVQGGLLLLVYTLGLSLPFLLITLSSSALVKQFNKLKPHMVTMKKVGGALIILMGIILVLGKVDAITAFFETIFN
ncbi:thiol-disulfide oxidoreductase-associated membrane protein CcdA2 [Streptococcus ovuberis]|uniref:Thiol-disulfide oxidoreductase-associated membrane protein CcdA2 n=1 Tax=Streptococcus ovuberis TaxID=1936207 RepID=A0A7X6MYU6_9STRE|nr:thiol-disulfide oxidoreductase-associated membrane protein CcdA2 [Streptococcus ovuberis]NKZ20376.1 thiol-disulfide oxidoreductase-associated membrane protein CcdA2 [Streptococcus ovuberis]